MENKLNNIQNDKLLIQLYNRIVSLKNTLEETDDIDLAISEIMTFMEKHFIFLCLKKMYHYGL